MMELNQLKPKVGSFSPSKRVGRGIGSGHGKTATRGMNGQKSRSGGNIHPRFEGGQMPLVRRIPKRGFRSLLGREWDVVNLENLNRFENDSTVDPSQLKEAGLVRRSAKKIKVLAKGDLKCRLTVRAHAFSQQAKEAIEEKGGRCEVE